MQEFAVFLRYRVLPFLPRYAEFKSVVKLATKGDVDISDLDIGDLVGDAAIAFIVLGAFFFLLGIFGCFGAICKAKSLLIVVSVADFKFNLLH